MQEQITSDQMYSLYLKEYRRYAVKLEANL